MVQNATRERLGHSLGDVAYARLRDMIETGELAPNAPLREVQLAGALKVSRTPIRDALRRLEAEGLVSFGPRQGMVVAMLDRQRVIELYSFLEVLECTAVRFMAQYATESEVEILNDVLQKEKVVLKNATALSALNRKFHSTLYRGARNRYLLKSVNAVRDTIFLLGKTTLGNPGRAKQAADEHRRIVAAIEARDEFAAETAMRRHIRSALRERLRILDQAEGVPVD